MAKAVFQRNQKVWVESVGAWAVIEKIVPVWAKGFDEPVRVTYEVGLGREFQAHELRAEADATVETVGEGGAWRLMRARNKWQTEEDCAHHPHPGTYPVVVTDEADWGGWRVPGAEYDRAPGRIEQQARLIASAPRLLTLARAVMRLVDESAGDAPPELQRLAEAFARLDRRIREAPAASPAPLTTE
ncbi:MULTISPECIES: hypothetical protein [Phenylobacterium]|uniref:SRPBCC family protein n=1 Tax=Phenylobacterium koreense TaxID=266125 RepID=A0ABV2EEH8_9CAUL